MSYTAWEISDILDNCTTKEEVWKANTLLSEGAGTIIKPQLLSWVNYVCSTKYNSLRE